MSNLVMFDSIYPDLLPSGASYCYAGYVAGRWPDYSEIKRRFPHARVLSIAVNAGNDADCLDIETGDATPADAAAWYERQRARGITRPCLYASAYVMQQDVVPVIEASGIARSAVRLWSAHYTGKAHICGPVSCRLMSIEADATQWTDQALGRDLDESLLLADFFGTPPAPPKPKPPANWTEAIVRELPVLRQGATGNDVKTVQGLCAARGRAVTIDGVYGNETQAAVTAIQKAAKVKDDGAVGPVTWPVLLGV